MNLDEIEQTLDSVFKEQRDYIVTAQSHYEQLMRIERTEENDKQLMRVYRKFTWLQVYPRNYKDGMWITF